MALEGCEVLASLPGRSLPRERPGTHCTGGWVGPVWIGTENLAPTRIRSSDRPARSLRYNEYSTGPR